MQRELSENDLQVLRGYAFHNVAGEKDEVDDVDEEGEVVEEASERAPLVVEQGRDQRVVQENFSL